LIKWRLHRPKTSYRLILNCAPSKIFHEQI
jgi:hypothetical protein